MPVVLSAISMSIIQPADYSSSNISLAMSPLSISICQPAGSQQQQQPTGENVTPASSYRQSASSSNRPYPPEWKINSEMKAEIDEHKANVAELTKDMLAKETRWVPVEKGVAEVPEGEAVNDDVL